MMNALATCAESQQILGDALAEARGSAYVDVSVVEISHELSKQLPVETHLLARPDDLVEFAAALAHELRHLRAMHDVLDTRGPQDHGHFGARRKVLEESPDGRDAHAGTDEYDLVATTGVPGEDAVRTFNEDARTGLEARRGQTLHSELLDCHPNERGSR